MKPQKNWKKTFILIIWIGIVNIVPSAYGAEKISFVNGIFSRSISIKTLENLAKTGKATGTLKKMLKFSNQKPKEVADLLNEEQEVPLVITSRLMYSSIGEIIIKRIAKIIYPNKVPELKVSIPAIRAAVTQGTIAGKGKLTLIQFLKSYPNKVITVNIPALSKIINRVESMSELIKFFSGSPLEQMKTGEVKDLD